VCKNWLNHPNRLGKNARKPQGGIFLTYCTLKRIFYHQSYKASSVESSYFQLCPISFYVQISYIVVVSLSEMSDEVQRVRPSRFLHPDGIVRPFVYHDAEGNQMLQVHYTVQVYLFCTGISLVQVCLLVFFSYSLLPVCVGGY